MSKRLILILALAFVVGIAFTAYAEVQNVKVSGDLNFIGYTRELRLNNNNQTATDRLDKYQTILHTIRLRVDADLTDNVMATVRLINDRYWGSDDATSANSDIDLDLAYVTLKEFLYSPATLMVGRQELHFGNEMIVGDSTTNNAAPGDSNLSSDPDLSMRKAFDAIRLILNYDPLVFDVITAKIDEDTIADEDDQNLYGIHANYPLDKNTLLEGYWFEKYTQKHGIKPVTGAVSQNKSDRVDTLGGRIVNKSIENLTYQLETAFQLGKSVLSATNTAKRRAWALETALTYDMPKVKYTPSLTGLYAYFTGRKGNDAKRDSAWDPMYENQKFGDITNAQFNQSNAHIAGVIGTMKPMDDIALKGEYYAYWWDKKYGEDQVIQTVRGDYVVMRHKKFAGQEIDLTATYDYTEDVQFSLLGGIFLPGSAFNKDGYSSYSASHNVATEVIGSMKVTF